MFQAVAGGSATTLSQAVGLDVSGESIPYVAGWGEDGGLDALFDATSSLHPAGDASRTASFLLRGCTAVPLHAVPA